MKRLLLFVLMFLWPLCACADLDLLVDGSLHGYAQNAITIRTDGAGLLHLSVEDEQGPLHTWREWVEPGDTPTSWNGLTTHGEPLPQGTYTLRAQLETYSGKFLNSETTVTLDKPQNALMYALPACDTLYLDAADDWFCEIRLVRRGASVVMDVYRADKPNLLIGTRKKTVNQATPAKLTWDGKLNGGKLSPGEYLMRVYLAENPDYAHEIALTIAAGKPDALPVAVTAPVLPERGMSDADIWAIMQQPSVVADVKQTAHLSLRSEKGKGRELGTVHGQSQALQVLKIEGDYAFVGAWNHESGEYVEGWVACRQLKTVMPNPHYGLLIDKATQTMTVYQEGVPIDRFDVSTGLVAEDRMLRETPAGAFLTVDRIGDFEDGGYQYDYAIRYDGGNLLHQLGYKQSGGLPDFTDHTVLLGAKASHGCIRIPNRREAPTQINAYWLYTHLPYHTRVLILDDPEVRLLQAAAAGEPVTVPQTTPTAPPALEPDEFEVTLTIGGDAVIGTREKWWDREDAFPAYIARYGLDYPFSGLQHIFQADDMTFVNLEGVLKADAKGEKKDKEYRFRGLPEWTEIIAQAGIEQVSIANNHHIDYGESGQDATRQALEEAGIPYSGFGCLYIWETQGVRIGFAGCREWMYLQDRTIVYREINTLRKAGCDLIIYTCHWGTEYAPHRNSTQERIAAAATAAGADIVLGGHPHVVQGVGTVEDTLVLYSLGNLMFGGTIDMTTFDGMLAQLRLRFGEDGYRGCTLSLIPVLTSGRAAEGINDYRPVVAQGEDRDRILQQVQADTAFPLLDEMWFGRRDTK